MHLRLRTYLPTAAAAALVLAIVCVARPARADQGIALRVEWERLGKLLQEGAAMLHPREAARVEAQDRYGSGSPDSPPWLGTALRVSLVARDWGSSQVLWGNLSLTDQMRLTRSTRMVVSRMRFANGRLAPFGQLGLGQWRIDQSILPTLPGNAQTAAQIGGGFELAIAPHATVALESDCTVLYHEGRLPETLSAAHVLSALLAARATF
ncbi:MAG TPA: hypothetical protein VIY73_22850 [Polyangiaceae bacterium]